MNNDEEKAGVNRLPDGTAAFTTIIREIGIVFHLDYRDVKFKKWHELAGTALDMFLGPLHPKTLEFQSLKIKHADTAITPEGQAVPGEDEMTYSASLETTKGILEFALNECRECDEAESRRIKKLKDSPPVQAAPPPMELHIIRTHVPGGSMQFDFGKPAKPAEQEEALVPEDPIGGLQIVARAGTTGAKTLEAFIKSMDDPQERELAIRLKEVLDNPGSSWTDVKMVLEEMLDIHRELALQLFPVIIKR